MQPGLAEFIPHERQGSSDELWVRQVWLMHFPPLRAHERRLMEMALRLMEMCTRSDVRLR